MKHFPNSGLFTQTPLFGGGPFNLIINVTLQSNITEPNTHVTLQSNITELNTQVTLQSNITKPKTQVSNGKTIT